MKNHHTVFETSNYRWWYCTACQEDCSAEKPCECCAEANPS